VSPEPLFVSVIIAAGGRGTRVGANVPKQWLTIGGRTLLDLSVAAFDAHPRVSEIVLVLPEGEEPRAMSAAVKPMRIVGGGPRRQDSVANGFASVSAQADVVLVHDAARPFVGAGVIDRTIDAAWENGAAIAALPVHDTVKRARWDGEVAMIAETLPRESIFLAQTPQGFRRDVLAGAVELGKTHTTTDEAGLAELSGDPVRLVAGEEANVKITTSGDLERARAIARREKSTMRIGLGYDSHRFVDGHPLRLGGVLIPHERGLAGHSDADAVCHAVTDAVLGAANLGDVGRLFPDTDVRWKNADSLALLADAWSRVREAGWSLGNLDVVIIADRPKIALHAEAIAGSLAAALDASPDAVALKGKTPEGTPALDNALVVHAVVLLTR
jgi:2-C-methyl-D-erythritol 4-phosphate cytidylyltransferase/2-C-methyl-D-erythritol 2,4-cyclodiphosphate synthase